MIALLLAACCLPSGPLAPSSEESPASVAPLPAAPAPSGAPAGPTPFLEILVESPTWPSGSKLFVTVPDGEACVWKMAGTDGGVVDFARSSACPESVVWSRDVLLADLGEQTVSRSWKVDALVIVPPLPKADCHLPYPAKDGALRRVCVVPTSGWMLDGETVPVGRIDDWDAYGLDGTKVVAPRGDGQDIQLPPWGSDAFAVLYTLEQGTWKRLVALPTRVEAGDVPGTSLLDRFLDEAGGFLSTPKLQACCACGQDCGIGDAGDEPEALGMVDPESVGSLPVGAGRVWFEVVFGDTPHAQAPVTYCDDPGCTRRVRWETVGDLVGVAPLGKHVLVGTEYSGAGARVFEANVEAPVLAFPEATMAVWVPEAQLPPLHARAE